MHNRILLCTVCRLRSSGSFMIPQLTAYFFKGPWFFKCIENIVAMKLGYSKSGYGILDSCSPLGS
jgi:hypothetical protein